MVAPDYQKSRCMTETTAYRVVRVKELVQILGIARSTIYDKLNPASRRFDPSFPQPIKLGSSSVGWLLPDVYQWLYDAARTQKK